MAFPSSPSNNQIATVNNIPYVYASATNTWTRTSGANIVIGNGSVASTSTSTGALVVNGGIGVSGALYNGGVHVSTGNIVAAATTVTSGVTSGALVVNGGVGIGGGMFINGSISSLNATTSTSTTTGALTVTGGVGVAGNIYLGGNIYSNNTISSSITSVLTHGNDGNFQLTSQNGPANNATGQETARFGINYAGTGWDTFTQYIRGAGAQTGSMTFWAANTAIATVQTGSIVPTANSATNLGATTAWWNNIYGTASHALYADLAENYTADESYEPGTVVVFGGTEEITTTTISHDSRVAGVVSTDPAYLMNGALENGTPVAFTGRVPCLVQGPVNKGDVLVTSETAKVAQRIDNSKFIPGCVLGKALEKIEINEIRLIEVVVGRF